MSKRFTDSDKFNDVWFRKLPLLQKVIWEYLLAECNYAGIFENFDFEMMSFKIGAEITKDDLALFKGRILFLNDHTVFIPKFITFQYGTLNPQSKMHKNIIKELSFYNIDYKTLSVPCGQGIDTLSIPRWQSIDTLKEMEKEKEKDKEKEKEKNSTFNVDVDKAKDDKTKIDPFMDGKRLFSNAYKKVFNKKALLGASDIHSMHELSSQFDDFYDTLPEVLEKIKDLNFNGYKPAARWILQEKNYTDVRNGVYDNRGSPGGEYTMADYEKAFKKWREDKEAMKNDTNC